MTQLMFCSKRIIIRRIAGDCLETAEAKKEKKIKSVSDILRNFFQTFYANFVQLNAFFKFWHVLFIDKIYL